MADHPFPLAKDELLAAYRRMRTIREFEERLHIDFGRGDIPGFVHLYAGEEAAAVGIMIHLGDGDRIASTHRGHGHCIEMCIRDSYYSLIPEALIASMLPPEKFGQYYATGHKFKSKGQAVFFEIDPNYRHPYFDIDGCYKRCVSKADGSPKNSIYVSMYRVTEHLTVSVLGKMYLTTAMGETLGLSRGDTLPKVEPELHMYQDLAPINLSLIHI